MLPGRADKEKKKKIAQLVNLADTVSVWIWKELTVSFISA